MCIYIAGPAVGEPEPELPEPEYVMLLCPLCGGEGQANGRRCRECNGRGEVEREAATRRTITRAAAEIGGTNHD